MISTQSVKTSSQSSHSSVGDNVEFQVPSNVTSPRRFQESQHSSTSSGQTFAKPLPPRSSGTFAKPAPPPPVGKPVLLGVYIEDESFACARERHANLSDVFVVCL